MSGLPVSRLFVYPIKSLAGTELDAAEVEARGFRHDRRRWMLVTGDGMFLSQRRRPRMALARARVEVERRVVDALGMPALELPLRPEPRPEPCPAVPGCVPYEEGRCRRVRVGGVGFRVVEHCSRCAITIVDQESGEKRKEPLRPRASYRKVGGKVYFGQNAFPDGSGRLRVGDAIEVASQI
jgi:uncharacterized protein YcbX